jgi:integrase
VEAEELVFGRKDGKPLCNGYFHLALGAELTAAGICGEEQRKRNIIFHSPRHTCVTLNRALGISDFEIQALAGPRTARGFFYHTLLSYRRCSFIILYIGRTYKPKIDNLSIGS